MGTVARPGSWADKHEKGMTTVERTVLQSEVLRGVRQEHPVFWELGGKADPLAPSPSPKPTDRSWHCHKLPRTPQVQENLRTRIPDHVWIPGRWGDEKDRSRGKAAAADGQRDARHIQAPQGLTQTGHLLSICGQNKTKLLGKKMTVGGLGLLN